MAIKIILLTLAPIAFVVAMIYSIHSLTHEQLWFKKRRFFFIPFAFLLSAAGGAPTFPSPPKEKDVKWWEIPLMIISPIALIALWIGAYNFFT